MEEIANLEKYQVIAQKLKAVAHPYRLCIVRGLIVEGECNVSTMQECLKLPQSTVSQHLAKLKAAGIVEGERQGLEICYKVVDEDIKKIIEVLFD
ncbi:ArsR/SmtB family transcription factor [Caldanaerobius polysaccharolyticus]|uniref:ArsR/SmtB family transcription factor n=1 Tax=Caldanaerobius polysaccharolyticus TaxID=44256 RepID=UPI00047E6252|nr:metalloregulator ArsR/SmtB family transcription factor [Caldanaerobius polysaccharolyticus]